MDNIFSFLNNQEMNYIFMEIRQLEYFRAIVDAGTISGATAELSDEDAGGRITGITLFARYKENYAYRCRKDAL